MIRRNLAVVFLALMACSEQEVLLEGERLDLDGNPVPVVEVNRSAPVALPRARANRDWTHVGGDASHVIAHPALSRSLNMVWSTRIGEGDDRKHRVTADPVVQGNRIFVKDSRALVSAVSTSGEVLWSTDLTPVEDNPDDGSGGGLAVSGNRVYATTGFSELSAVDAATGAVVWQHSFDAGTSAPPTVFDGVVYVATTNAVGWALSAQTGQVLWQVFGAVGDRSSAGSSAPVIAGPLVVFPFSSGQMVSAERATGTQTWAASVVDRRAGSALSAVTDLTGGPVFDGSRIFAGTFGGSSSAVDATTGQPIWQGAVGAAGPIWVAGDSVFYVSEDNRLVRLNASSGAQIWARDLPRFTRQRIKRRKAVFVHHGPVLAGGRLILVSDDGLLRQFDPASGSLIATVELPDGAATNPAVAGGRLYVVSEDGDLLALQ